MPPRPRSSSSPTASTSTSSRSKRPTMRPWYITSTTSDRSSTSLRSSEKSSTPRPESRSPRTSAAHGLGGAEVEPARERSGEQDVVGLGQLAGQDRLLQVAARQEADRHAGAVAADVEVVGQPLRRRPDRSWRQHPSARVRRPVEVLEHQVVLEGEPRGQPGAKAILRHVRESGVGAGPRRRAACSPPRRWTPGRRWPSAGRRSPPAARADRCRPRRRRRRSRPAARAATRRRRRRARGRRRRTARRRRARPRPARWRRM